MDKNSEALFRAIEALDVEKATQLLELGTDPNAIDPAYAAFPHYELQPYSPLRLIAFYVSDALLNPQDFEKLHALTVLLLNHGADPKPANELAELRYGKIENSVDTPMAKVLKLIHQASKID